MKKLILSLTVLTISAGMAAATSPDCKKSGGGYVCQIGGDTHTAYNATSEAEAIAIALAKQEQSQEQSQSQTAEGGSATAINGGNTVSISNPKHTTSVGLGLNIGVDIPIGRGIQGASCRETVLLAHQLGYHDIALHVLLECPHVRKLKLKVNPGDKG